MRVIVVGCGRVGARLARTLDAERHTVGVVDREPATRELLGPGFRGLFVEGGAISRPVLERVGVREAEALVAVTSSDTANVVAARAARLVYRVPVVLARVYDPRRADLFTELGITTVSHVQQAINEVRHLLFHRDLVPEWSFGNGETVLVRSHLADHLAGRPVAELEIPGAIRVVEVTRHGRSLVARPDLVAEPGDLVSFVVVVSALDHLRPALAGEV